MNGGIAPFLLIASTLGLLLGLVPTRLALFGAAAFVVSVLIGFAAPTLFSPAVIFTGLFLSMIVIGALVYVPAESWRVAFLPVCIDAGLWLGGCAALTDDQRGLVLGLIPILIAIPVHWIANTKFAILIKVVASWMIAIASLSLFVSLMPTPGYKPDHME